MKKLLTIVEEVDLKEIAKVSAKEREELQQLDWSLSLLIACTNFGFDELIKQYEQAQRLYCTETQAKIEEVMKERYAYSWKMYKEENKPDMSSADGTER